ncbi:MAG: hypothetical protein ACE5IW_10250 [bacterium]
MAKVQYGAIIDEITGSIGGWTFHRNRSGAIVRARGGALKNSTVKQTQAHQKHIKFLQLYQQLTQANKDLWDAYSLTFTKTNRFGQVKTLTGQNWFESINYYRDLLSLSILNAPPVHTLPVDVQAYNFVVGSTEIEVNFDPAFNPVDNALLIFTTPFNTRVTTSQRQFMRLTKIIDSGPFGNIDITSDWEDTHSVPWPPSPAPICGRVAIQVQTINKSSGISSTALSKTDAVVSGQEGIGFWIIEFDFEVQ